MKNKVYTIPTFIVDELFETEMSHEDFIRECINYDLLKNKGELKIRKNKDTIDEIKIPEKILKEFYEEKIKKNEILILCTLYAYASKMKYVEPKILLFIVDKYKIEMTELKNILINLIDKMYLILEKNNLRVP